MFSAKADEYIDAPPKRINILHGAVRSGKTTNTLVMVPERFLEAPRGDILITGKTERTAYRNVVAPLVEMFGERRVKYAKGSGEGRLGGRTFYLVGANNELAENKIRGLTVGYWLADELNLYPESFVTQGLARMSPEGACCDWTMNPGPPKHYVKTDYIDREGELDAKVWHFLMQDNPHLSQTYVENLKREYGGPGTLYYQRYIDGLWVLAEGTIHDYFNERLHVLKGAPPKADFYTAAVDYGTSSVTTFGLFGHLNRPSVDAGYSGLQCWLERLYYHDSRKPTNRQKTLAEHAADFKDFLGVVKPKYIIVDPSASAFKLELFRNNFRQVMNARNDVLPGIQTHQKMMQQGRFKVHESCKDAIDEYAMYVWDEKAQAAGIDKPLKENDHACDMTRYCLHTVYGRSIQN